MPRPHFIIKSAYDRRSAARSIVATFAAAVFIAMLLAPTLRGDVQIDPPPRGVDDGISARHRFVSQIENGRCLFDGSVIGPTGLPAHMKFLADTGADGLYFTIPSHARALGIEHDHLKFDHSYHGWGSTGRGATIVLRELRIGGWSQSHVRASIDDSDFSLPLLGLPLLKLLHFRVIGDTCEVSWS